MANLTQNEKELLAVVKYYNGNEKKIDRLIYKLVEGLSIEQAAILSGYNEETVKAIHREVKESKPKRKFRTTTERMLEQAKTEIPAMVDEELVKQGETRLAIHVNSTSERPVRIAHDISKRLEKGELKSGDQFWTTRDIIERFSVSRGTATEAIRILRKHNWIEYIDPNRVRLGLKVK